MKKLFILLPILALIQASSIFGMENSSRFSNMDPEYLAAIKANAWEAAPHAVKELFTDRTGISHTAQYPTPRRLGKAIRRKAAARLASVAEETQSEAVRNQHKRTLGTLSPNSRPKRKSSFRSHTVTRLTEANEAAQHGALIGLVHENTSPQKFIDAYNGAKRLQERHINDPQLLTRGTITSMFSRHTTPKAPQPRRLNFGSPSLEESKPEIRRSTKRKQPITQEFTPSPTDKTTGTTLKTIATPKKAKRSTRNKPGLGRAVKRTRFTSLDQFFKSSST